MEESGNVKDDSDRNRHGELHGAFDVFKQIYLDHQEGACLINRLVQRSYDMQAHGHFKVVTVDECTSVIYNTGCREHLSQHSTETHQTAG